MPAQRGSAIWHPFAPAIGAHPEISRVYKVFTRGKALLRYHYYYFSRKDKKWYCANGHDRTAEVISWGVVE